MSDRDKDREYLARALERGEDWAARMVHAFGMEGTLDLFALQRGNVWGIDLRHRPFAGDIRLKARIRSVQEAVSDLTREAFLIGWEAAR